MKKSDNKNNSLKKSAKVSLGKRNKQRGNEYEIKIAKELRDLGFCGVVTSRSESVRMDANKVDLIDVKGKLPFFPQLKRTAATPSYFAIREETTVPKDKFVIFWNKQRKVNNRFMSDGECVILSKEFFYELIKPYTE